MAPPAVVSNGAGGITAVKSAPVTGRISTVYSEVQNSRIDHALPLPAVIKNAFSIVDGPDSSAAGNPGCILSLFVSLSVSICVCVYVICYYVCVIVCVCKCGLVVN